jgi:ArsR family transcriptional regulator
MNESSSEGQSPSPGRRGSAEDCADKLKVLGEPTRLSVVELLIAGPLHVSAMNAALGLEQSLLSHHLRVLRDGGIVEGIRDGKAVLYRLAPGLKLDGFGIDLGCCKLSFRDSS